MVVLLKQQKGLNKMLNVKTELTLLQAKTIAAGFGVNVKSRPYLISKPDANPKTGKNLKFGILTSPLHLAPANLSGFEVCANRSPGCSQACLHTAGNPVYMVGKERARIAKTKLYFESRMAFMVLLFDDLVWLANQANNKGLVAGFRPNATSDIPWEKLALNGLLLTDHAKYLKIELYDYTKNVKRALTQPYHLTFSRSENNQNDCIKVLNAGHNVAVVFSVSKTKPLPAQWQGFDVIDGDESDWRPGDKRGVVVGLKAKGDAKKDQSGFVVV
jgi:hypothetical protein